MVLTSPESTFQLAQLNIALARKPLESELLAEFVAALEPVNAEADAAPGTTNSVRHTSYEALWARSCEPDTAAPAAGNSTSISA